MAAVLIAMIAAITVLPALLGVLGHRVDALRIPLPWRRKSSQSTNAGGLADPDSGAWARLARAVMRRPMVVVAGTVTFLVILGLPFLNVAFGGVDSRVLPQGTESRSASAHHSDFPGGSVGAPIDVVVTALIDQRWTAMFPRWPSCQRRPAQPCWARVRTRRTLS